MGRFSLRTVGWVAALVALAGLIVASAETRGGSGRYPLSPAAPGRPAHITLVKTFAQLFDEAAVRATTGTQWATIARRNAVVVLNSWDFDLIPVLKRVNPGIQVWVYKDLSGVRSDDCMTASGDCGVCPQGVMDSGYLSSGTGYCWVKRNHPDWLLRAAGTGRPIEFRGYPHTWETDYGNPVYQRQWIHNVLTDVRRHGWDGVEVDNALTTADAYGLAAKYRSDAAVQAATYSALRDVGPALHDAGVASVFNVGYATRFPGLWQRWLTPVDGLEQEFYLSYSTQPNATGAAWLGYQDEVSSCAALHKRCWFHSGDYSVAVTSQTGEYALASFLLVADSRQLLAVGDTVSVTVARQWALGTPVTTMKQVGGTWRRYFTSGIAIVNSAGSWSTVSLGGTYLNDSGHPVSAVALAPASGAILLRHPATDAINASGLTQHWRPRPAAAR